MFAIPIVILLLDRATPEDCVLAALVYSAGWEYSVRRYLDGFSDAIVPANALPEQRVEAILDWMRQGPPRSAEPNPTGLAVRDPETTLNYQQLLSVCGTATNAFLNLARSSGLQVRRLLLLSPDRAAKHVVAEVLLNARWIVVDPTYRIVMRNAKGEMLTRKELQAPQNFAEATGKIPGYPPAYTYDKFAHVRIARLPLDPASSATPPVCPSGVRALSDRSGGSRWVPRQATGTH